MSDRSHDDGERSNVRRRSLLGTLAALGAGYGVATTATAGARAATDTSETGAAAATAGDSAPFAAVLERRLSSGDDADPYDGFGSAVAVDDDTAVVGARGDEGEGVRSGSAFVFRRTDRGWRREARLRPEGLEDGDGFGQAVAVHGETVVVGAYGDDEVARESGAVYVFERSDGTWERTTKLTLDDAERWDYFGGSVALDGDALVVGTLPEYDALTGTDGAYVYRRSDGAWAQEAKLTVEGLDWTDVLGGSVAVAGDTVLVGATREDDGGAGDAGTAYAFRRRDGEWTREARLGAPDPTPEARFGWNLALDGDTAVVGALRARVDGDRSGAAYAFGRTDDTWTREATLLADEPEDRAGFGNSVAVHGNVVLVGSPRDLGRTGLAFVFARRDDAWDRVARFEGESTRGPTFGDAVSLAEGLALVGSPGSDVDGRQSGAAFSFASVHTRDAIARAKYDLDFEGLSVETTGQVEGIFNRQPFPDGLDPASIRTREQIAEAKFGGEFEESTLERELDRDRIVELQDAYDEQFGPLPPDPTYSRDDISRAKYRTPFSGLSVETRGQVEGIYNRQPFAETLEPPQVRTREQIAEAEYGGEFEERTLSERLNRNQIVEVQDAYDGQFGPVPRSTE